MSTKAEKRVAGLEAMLDRIERVVSGRFDPKVEECIADGVDSLADDLETIAADRNRLAVARDRLVTERDKALADLETVHGAARQRGLEQAETLRQLDDAHRKLESLVRVLPGPDDFISFRARALLAEDSERQLRAEVGRVTAERDTARRQVCSHATGAHDQSCDLVAGLERELAALKGKVGAS